MILVTMFREFLTDLIDEEYYMNLWQKYRDKDRKKYKTQRVWANENYKTYIYSMLREKQFRTAWELKKAETRCDYKTMYNIMIDWDGSTDYIL